MASELVLLATALIVFLITGVRCDYCLKSNYLYNSYNYCPNGCCSYYSDGCCPYNYYGSSAFTIAVAVGCSIGGVILIGIIIAIICCCVRRRGSHGQIVTTATAQPIVTTSTTSNNMAVGGVSGPYPMQPVGNPWYPQPQAYGGPPPQAYGGPPPQMQPGYSQPPGLPTYSPPSNNAGLSQPQAEGYNVNLSSKDGNPPPGGNTGYNQPAGQPGYSQPGPPAYGL